jgi:hypothetical protein
MMARGLTFGLGCREDAYATAMLFVVNAHQSLAAERIEKEKASIPNGIATDGCLRCHPRRG